MTAKQKIFKSTKYIKNAHSRILGSAPTNSDLVARKRRLLNTRVTLLHVYLAVPPVCVCCCVYLCVPVLLCNCVRCICKLLLAHIAASIQFRNGREEKNFGTFETSQQPLESQCALQRSHHSAFEAVLQSLEVISHQ